MTRDEALKTLEDAFNYNVPTSTWIFTPLRLMEALAALGMLKLDEPKSAAGKLSTLLWQFNLAGSENAFRELLDANGLKIVEK